MTRFVLRRLLGAVPLVLGVATLVFVVVNAAPGDPGLHLVSPSMTGEAVERIRTNFGLDDPLPVRYARWLGALLTGSLGESFSHARPVADVLVSVLPNTLLLSGLALTFAFGAGIVLGTLQAERRGSRLDHGLNAVLLFFHAMPSFWLALMLVLVFSVLARNALGLPFWFPASGMVGPAHDDLGLGAALLDRLRHLVLPVAALGLVMVGGVARTMRACLLEVLEQDYVVAARARGLPRRVVLFRHALRNALIPMATLVGLHIPVLLGGAVFVESVFAWPGMGRLMVDAIGTRDYPLVMGGTFLFALLVILGNLLADVLTAWADPRVREGTVRG